MSEDLVDKLESDYHQKVWQLIRETIDDFGDIKVLIIAVDGVAPLSKQYQQKQRRSKSSIANNADVNFDSNMITSGTEYMLNLDNFLKEQIIKDRKNLPEKVIYNSTFSYGEGEHKIYQYFRDGELTGLTGHAIVIGLDADLVMLSLLSPQSNIILSREGQEDMIHIDHFKTYLQNTLKTKTALQDFVIMVYLLGNDFLKHSPGLEVSAETINMMIDIYKRGNYKFVNGKEVDVENFLTFIDKLSDEEPQILEQLSTRNDYQSIPLNMSKLKGFDLNTYREAYYENEFGPKGKTIPLLENLYTVDDNKIQQMAHDYMKTICWNFIYYNEGTDAVNSQWLYAYSHAPMLVDLAMFNLGSIKNYRAFKGMTRFSPIHQLVSVLPQKSINIVPEELKPLFKTDSPIYDLFPTTFINEQEGKIMKKMPGKPMIDHGIAIIPLIDQRRIIDIVSTIDFSPKRLALWAPQEPVVSIDIHPFKGKPMITQTYQQPYRQPQQSYQQPYRQPQQSYQNRQNQQSYQQPQQPYQQPQQSYQQPQQSYQQPYQQPQQPQQSRQNQSYQQPYRQPQQSYQNRQNQQYQQIQPQQSYQPYQQSSQSAKQYQQIQPSQNQPYQPRQQTYQRPRQEYQVKPKVIDVKYEQKVEPVSKVMIETPIILKNMPPMLNVDLLQNFIRTGKTPTKKSAKELIDEADWNEL